MAKKIAKSLIKKLLKEIKELKLSEKDKERYRKGKQALKSNVPQVQKALDKAHGGSTLKVVKTKKPIKKRDGGMIGGGRQSRQDRQR